MENTERHSELENALIEARNKLETQTRIVKIYTGIVVGGLTFIILHYSNVLDLDTWLLLTDIGITILLLFAILGTDLGKLKSEVEKIEAIKRINRGFLESGGRPDYFDTLVKINVENLAAFYSLAKIHTSQSFKVSLIASICGLGLIIVGLIIGYRNYDKTTGYVACGSGVIIEFISVTLFFLYNKTITQLKEYHDSLIGVQNILLSFKLIESTGDAKAKVEMVGKLMEYLVQKK